MAKEADYRLTVTVYPPPESMKAGYHPVTFGVLLPESLARVLMATPVGNVGLAIESRPGILTDKSRLVSFK